MAQIEAPPAAPHLAELGRLAHDLAARPGEWLDRVRFSPDGRWYERLRNMGGHEIWLISWLPGEGTGFHDHGCSAGAFVVVLGELEEHQASRWDAKTRRLGPGASRAFGPRYVHDVRNASSAPAVSVHAYAPELREMNRYELTSDGLEWTSLERAGQW